MNEFSFSEQMYLDHFNLQPSSVKGSANPASEYNKRYLYNLLYSVFKFNLPKSWHMDWFRFWLFHFGSIGVIYTNEYGWIDQPYSVTKLDLQYEPSEIMVTNKDLPTTKNGVIGVNAGIIKLFDDYYGIDDLVTHYAEQLAQIDRNFNVTNMTATTSLLFEAENKKEADAIREAYGKATTGDPLIVMKKRSALGDSSQLATLLKSPKENYLGQEYLDARRRVMNDYLTKIGIRNANYEKRERLNSQEVSENNDETSAIVSVMLENIRSGMELINSISDLNLGVELVYTYGSTGAKESEQEVNEVG